MHWSLLWTVFPHVARRSFILLACEGLLVISIVVCKKQANRYEKKMYKFTLSNNVDERAFLPVCSWFGKD